MNIYVLRALKRMGVDASIASSITEQLENIGHAMITIPKSLLHASVIAGKWRSRCFTVKKDGKPNRSGFQNLILKRKKK